MTTTPHSSPDTLASAKRPHQSGRIVVGVDTSEGSLNALRWAFGEARARKIPVHAILAWQYQPTWVDPGLGSMFPLSYRPSDDGPTDAYGDLATAVEQQLDAVLGKAIETDPDNAADPVRITRETVEGHAAQVLIDSVTADDLMVVGSHGHGGFVGAILGSISHHVVAHSPCPVVVVPAPRHVSEG